MTGTGREYSCEKCGARVRLSLPEYLRLRAGKWGRKVLCAGCTDVKPQPRRTARSGAMTAATLLHLSPGERESYGVTMTIRNDAGDLATIVGHGTTTEATRDCVGQIERREGVWKILSVSSPASVFTDLQGVRDENAMTPENFYLSRIGRTDLLVDVPVKFPRKKKRK